MRLQEYLNSPQLWSYSAKSMTAFPIRVLSISAAPDRQSKLRHLFICILSISQNLRVYIIVNNSFTWMIFQLCHWSQRSDDLHVKPGGIRSFCPPGTNRRALIIAFLPSALTLPQLAPRALHKKHSNHDAIRQSADGKSGVARPITP